MWEALALGPTKIRLGSVWSNRPTGIWVDLCWLYTHLLQTDISE